MRRITVALMSTLSSVVLLFSYHASTSSSTALAGGGAVATGSPTAGSSSSGQASSSDADPSASGTYTGTAVSTRWGPVQVKITVVDGRITAAQAVEYPTSNPRDQQINAYAIPVLNQEAVTQQSADIDMVSGATVTSQGYLQSLQSAIDQAHA